MTAAIRQNPTLEATAETLRQAQESTIAQQGAFFPAVSAQLTRTRQKVSGAEAGLVGPQAVSESFGYYQGQFNISYTFDVWGQIRRTVEASAAAAQVQRFQLEGATNMLAANTATAAITAASLRAQIAAEQDLVDAEQHLLTTVRSQFQLGGATGTDVATQEAQLANTQALVVPLQTQLQQARDQLAAYLGRVPEAADIPSLRLEDLSLPGALPVSVPSRLVDQRPDIRAAAEQLHQATAQVGVAIANRLPQFTLTGALGSAPARIGDLFTPGNGIYTIITQALAPVFQGGTLLHQQRAAYAGGACGGGELSRGGGGRVPERGGRADGAGRRRAGAGGQPGGRAGGGAQPEPGAAAIRRGRGGVPDGADVADAIPERGDRADTGPGRAVYGHGGAVRGAGRRVVEPGRSAAPA